MKCVREVYLPTVPTRRPNVREREDEVGEPSTVCFIQVLDCCILLSSHSTQPTLFVIRSTSCEAGVLGVVLGSVDYFLVPSLFYCKTPKEVFLISLSLSHFILTHTNTHSLSNAINHNNTPISQIIGVFLFLKLL